MAKKPCRRCQQLRYTGFVLAALMLIGYGLMRALAG